MMYFDTSSITVVHILSYHIWNHCIADKNGRLL